MLAARVEDDTHAARLLLERALERAGRLEELEALLEKPQYRNNPTLNTAQGYWALVAARTSPDGEAAAMLVAPATACTITASGAKSAMR